MSARETRAPAHPFEIAKMQSILDQIRAEIVAAEERLEKLRTAETLLGELAESLVIPAKLAGKEKPLPWPSEKRPREPLTKAIEAQLGESGPMTKGNLEKALSASRSLGKQAVSASLQAMKSRGVVKLLKSGKWKLI